MIKTVQVEIDNKEVLDALGRLSNAVADPTLALKGVGEVLRNAAQDRFKTQIAPDGSAWQPLVGWYKAFKPKNADKALTLDGNLQYTLAFQVEGDEVLIGSGLLYAAIHQFGGTIRPTKAKALRLGKSGHYAKSVTIPARPYLGVSPDDAQAVENVVAEYLENVI